MKLTANKTSLYRLCVRVRAGAAHEGHNFLQSTARTLVYSPLVRRRDRLPGVSERLRGQAAVRYRNHKQRRRGTADISAEHVRAARTRNDC